MLLNQLMRFISASGADCEPAATGLRRLKINFVFKHHNALAAAMTTFGEDDLPNTEYTALRAFYFSVTVGKHALPINCKVCRGATRSFSHRHTLAEA